MPTVVDAANDPQAPPGAEPAARPAGARWPALVPWAITALSCLGVAGNGWRAADLGWRLGSDNGTMAINAWNTWHGHPRLLGVYSSAAGYAEVDPLYHPGPITAWLSGPFAALLGWRPSGFLLFAVVVNVVSLVTATWVAVRRGGLGVATAVALAGAVLVWAVGPTVPHDIWNPYIVVLPWFATLLLTWGVVERDPVALVVWVAFASFVLQNHFAYGPPVVLMVLGLTALVLWRALRDPDEAERRRWRRWGAGAGALGALLWAPVVVQQLTGEPGNLGQLWLFVRQGPDHGTRGAGYGLDRLAGFLGTDPLWVERSPNFFDLARPHTTADLVVLAALGLLAAVAVAAHWRGRRPELGRLVAIAGAAVVLLALAASQMPTEAVTLAPYNHRAWWPTTVLFLTTLVVAVVALVPEAWRTRLPALAPPLLSVVAIVAVGALMVPVVDRAALADKDDSPGLPALQSLTRPIGPGLPDDGTYLVVSGGSMASLIVHSPLVMELLRRGVDVKVATEHRGFGDVLTIEPGDRLDGVIVALSGPAADDDVPPGGTLVISEDGGGGPGADGGWYQYPYEVRRYGPSHVAAIAERYGLRLP